MNSDGTSPFLYLLTTVKNNNMDFQEMSLEGSTRYEANDICLSLEHSQPDGF